MKPRVLTGLDQFVRSSGRSWRNKRLGLIVHGASVTAELEPAATALERAGFQITTLFAPEHGIAADLQDQASVKRTRDPHTKRPVYSLYGSTLSPTLSMLKDLDGLLFDLQDIGVRYYTFIWTMALALRSCANARLPFIVLDRPNPLGGIHLEGNIPDPAFASFVGLHPLPVVHGMTVGELARYFNRTQGWKANVHVVPMSGWKRTMRFNETGLPWVLPSPNMPTLDTATVYAGMCLLEATNLSEGRGTTRPFELVGAPFLDGVLLAQHLTDQKLPGVKFRPISFRPTFNKWAGTLCGGVQLHVTDPSAFQSFYTGLVLLQTVHHLTPKFRWKGPPYEYETKKKPMDILCGTDKIRRTIDQGTSLSPLLRSWESQLKSFRQSLKHDLLYFPH
ncbi:MAG: DUF1343 domain-containing protein [Elusimicrobia bacterium]|jgi:uncharacterized protein YbbC (DUF1343 family)|nr:DUF1343 domain-containing protein [Elusimicrobiota bacterium]